MQPRSPAMEANMEKISTAAMTLPLVLWRSQAGSWPGKPRRSSAGLRGPGIPGYSRKQWPSPCTPWWDPQAQNECPSQGKGERLDCGGVSVLHKDPQSHSCDGKNRRAMQVSDIPKESSKARRGNSGEKAVSLHVWRPLVWALVTLSASEEKVDSAFLYLYNISICGKQKHFLSLFICVLCILVPLI